MDSSISRTQVGSTIANAYRLIADSKGEAAGKKTDERLRKLYEQLDEALANLNEHSVLTKSTAALEPLQKVLASDYAAFAQVHCGRTAAGTLYEEGDRPGNNLPVQKNPVSLLQAMFKWIKESGLSLTDSEEISQIQARIGQLAEIIEKQSALAGLKDDHFRHGVQELAGEIAHSLNLLEINQEQLLAVGPPASGMFLRLVRCESADKRFNLFLYESGSEELQGGASKGVIGHSRPLYVFENVPAASLYFEGLDKKLQSPLLAELLAITSRKVDFANSKDILEFFGPIMSYRADADRFIEHFIRCQRSKMSSHKALNGLILHCCGSERKKYKRLSIDIRLATMIAEYQAHEKEIDQPSNGTRRNQLRSAANNLLKSVGKYAGAQHVLTLEEAKRLFGTSMDLLAKIDAAEARAQKLQADPRPLAVKNSKAAALNKQAQQTAAWFKHPAAGNQKPYQTASFMFRAAAPRDPAELKSSLEKLKAFTTFHTRKTMELGKSNELEVKLLDKEGEFALEDFIFSLPSPSDSFWDRIPQEQVMDCLNLLSGLNECYGQAIANYKQYIGIGNHPKTSKQIVTLFNFYANIHKLALRMDGAAGASIIADLPLDISRFDDVIEMDPFHTIHHFHILQRRRELISYFKGCDQKGGKEGRLFSWKNFSIDPSGADLELCKRLYAHPAVKERMAAADVQEFIKGWAEAAPSVEQEAEKRALQKIYALLHLDAGRSVAAGYGKFPKRENRRFDSFLAVLPHLAALKRASIAMAVLLDVNSQEAKMRFSNSDRKAEPSRYEIKDQLAALMRTDLAQHIEKDHALELIFQSRGLEIAGPAYDWSLSGHYTQEHISVRGRTHVVNALKTGMFKTQAKERMNQNRPKSVVSSQLSKYDDLATVSGWELAEQVTNPSVGIHNLLQWMRRHPEIHLQSQLEEWSRLAVLLFRPHYNPEGILTVPLIDELKTDPGHMITQIRHIISEGITRYYLAQPNKRPKVQAVAAYLNLAQQINRNYSEIHGKPIHPPLYEADLIDQLLLLEEDATAFTKEEETALYLCQFTQLFPHSSPAEVSDDDLKAAAIAWIKAKSAGISFNPDTFGTLQVEAMERGGVQMIEEMVRRNKNPAFISSFADLLTRTFGLPSLSLSSQQPDKVPIFQGKRTDENWLVDLGQGYIYRNGERLGFGGSKPKNTLWTHLFMNRNHTFQPQGNRLYFNDSVFGRMCYIEGENNYRNKTDDVIQRLIGNTWYTLVPPDSKDLATIVPGVFRAGYSHWIANKPEAGDFPVMVCDLETGIPAYVQNKEGHFLAVDKKAKWDGTSPSIRTLRRGIAVREPEENIFNRLLKNGAVGLHEEGEVEASRVEFPQLITSRGEPLVFRRLGSQWVYDLDPSYVLEDPQLDKLFPHHDQLLVLRKRPMAGSAGGELKVLMLQPLAVQGKLKGELRADAFSPSVRLDCPSVACWDRNNQAAAVCEFRVVDGLLEADYAEDKLYLAWQLLAGKDYGRAMAVLRQLGAGDKLKEGGRAFIDAILSSERSLNDYSSEACAIRLKVLDLAKLLDPRREIPSIIQADPRRTIKDLCLGYLQGLDRMPAAVALTQKELKTLHEAGCFNGIPTEQLRWNVKSGSGKGDYTHPWNSDKKLFLPHFMAEKPTDKYFNMYVEGSLMPKANQSEETGMPIFGDAAITVRQFYSLYEKLKNPAITREEKDAIAYYMQHFSHQEKTFELAETVNRINILKCAYTSPEKAPLLPENKSDVAAWRTWLEDLQKAFPEAIPSKQPPKRSDDGKLEKCSASVEKSIAEHASRAAAASEPTLAMKSLPDQPVDFNLLNLCASYFDVREGDKQEPVPAPLAMPAVLHKKDEQYREGIAREFNFYASECGIAHNQKILEPQILLKGEKKGDDLFKDVKQVLDRAAGLKGEADKLEATLLLMMKKRQTGVLADWARQESPVMKDPSLIDIIRACTRGTPGAYRALNPYLSDEEITEIHQLAIELMLIATTYRQLKKVESELKKWKEAGPLEAKVHWDKAVDLLHTARCYSCATPEDIQANLYNLHFEFKAELRIRAKQDYLLKEIIRRLDSGEELDMHLVFQLIMGGGKTSVILSILLDLVSEKNRLAVLILDPSQFDAILPNVQKYQKERFNKDVIPVDYTREQLNDLATVKSIYATLVKAFEDRNGIAMKSTMPQVFSLELRKIAADLRDGNAIDFERAKELGKILKLLAEKSVFLADEIDLILNIIKQLNFTNGEAERLPQEIIDIISDLFLAIEKQKLADFSPGYRPLEEAEYKEKVMPGLSEASAETRKIPPEHRAAYKRYACNAIDGKIETSLLKGEPLAEDASKEEQENYAYLRYLNQELKRNEAGLQALSHYLISKVLPQVLSLEPDRHIGFDPSGNGKVIPFLGRKNPAPTELANPYEAGSGHLYCALTLGILKDSIIFLAEKMRAEAEEHAVHTGGFDNTPEARDFFELTGVSLSRASKGKDIDKIIQHFENKENRHHVVQFQAKLASIHATHYLDFLTSDAYDIPNFASANVACTATPYNIDTYDRFSKPIMDEGTEGKILLILRRLGAGKRAIVLPSEGSTTENFFKLIDKEDLKTELGKLGTLFDTAGTLRESTGEQFARAYLEYYRNNPERNSVVFFHRYYDAAAKKYEGKFAVMRKQKEGNNWIIDDHPHLLDDTTPEALAKADIDISTMFLFLDENSTTGVDFTLSPTCRGFLTFNPQTQTIKKTEQGALRFRGIDLGQDLEHVIPEQYLDYYGSEQMPPTVDEMLVTAILNQGRQKAMLVDRAFREMTAHAPRKVVQKGLIHTAADGDLSAFGDFVKTYGDYLDTKFKGDLLAQFGRLTVSVDTVSHLAELRAQELQRFPKGTLEQEVAQALEKLGKEVEKVRGQGLLSAQMNAPAHLPALGTQVQVVAQKAQEAHKHGERQVEIERELQLELDTYKPKDNKQYKEAKEKEWRHLDGLKGELPGAMQGVPVFTIREYLEKNRHLYPKARCCYHEAFPADPGNCPLFFSDNFVQSVEYNNKVECLPVFSLGHKTISHLLVSLDEKGQACTLALTNQEFEMWQSLIRRWESQNVNKPYWIINLNKEIAAGKGEWSKDMRSYNLPYQLDSSPAIKNALLYANFFNGDIDYLLGHPEETKAMMQENGQFKLLFLKTRCGLQSAKRKLLDSSPCFKVK